MDNSRKSRGKSLRKTPLQLALFNNTKPAWKIAHECGLTETRLSRIAAGRLQATPEEKERIAAALDKKAEQLFTSQRGQS